MCRKGQRFGKGKMLRSWLKRRIEKIIDVAMRVLYIEMRYVFVVSVSGVFVAVQSQYSLFRRQYATEKQ